MSKQTYVEGFCKAAAAKGIDPKALARYVLSKEAQDGEQTLAQRLKDALGDAKVWYDRQNEGVKGLIGAGTGALVGTGLGAALGGKGVIRTGSILGAIAGGASTVDWKKLSDELGKLADQSRARAKAKADAAAREAQAAADQKSQGGGQ